MSHHTARHEARPVESEVLARELDNSQSAVIYVDIPGMDDTQAAAMLTADPPLHVEFDEVRQKWAVRKATDEEVAEAKAAAEPPADKPAEASVTY
jgi:hypothetical protein